MFARISRIVLLLVPLAAALGCQSPDVGDPCKLSWGTSTPVPDPSTVTADYIEFNAANGCENLVCMISPSAGTGYGSRGPLGGYCSKPCTADRDCYQSATGLVCRAVVLDQDFLASLDPATRDRYLGDIQYSRYCAVPE